ATVNACAHRSGASVPAVALTTSVRAMGDSIGSTPRGCGDRPAPEDRRCHGHRDRVRRPAGGRVRPARRRAGLPGREGGAGRMSQALPPPWLDAPPVTPYPYRDSHDPAGGGPDPHPALLALLPFVGLWGGRGRGGYPTIEEFDYGQEIRISHDGRPFLAYESRAWLLDGHSRPVRPAARESGWWRPVVRADRPTGEVEVLITTPTGIMELY